MNRHPNEANIKQSRLIELKDLGLKFTVPQLFEIDRTIVKIYMGDQSRGVIDNYLLISANDLEPPFAAVVITELPEPMQVQSEAFRRFSMVRHYLVEFSLIVVVPHEVSDSDAAAIAREAMDAFWSNLSST